MALNFNNFETVLQTKLDTITDEKDMLLLGKAIEATVGNVAVSEIQAEGATQVTAVGAEGSTQISAVQAQGTSERNQINAMSSGFATTSSLSPVATSGSATDLSNLRTVGGQSIAGPGGDIATLPAGGSVGQVIVKDSSNNPSWGTGGKVISIKTSVKTNQWAMGNLGASYHAVSDLAVTLTPKSASSKFYISCSMAFGSQPGHASAARIYRNGTFFNQPDSGSTAGKCHASTEQSSSDGGGFMQVTQVDAPNTTSNVTYQVYVGTENPSGTFRVGTAGQAGLDYSKPGYHGRSTNTIMVIEYED